MIKRHVKGFSEKTPLEAVARAITRISQGREGAMMPLAINLQRIISYDDGYEAIVDVYFRGAGATNLRPEKDLLPDPDERDAHDGFPPPPPEEYNREHKLWSLRLRHDAIGLDLSEVMDREFEFARQRHMHEQLEETLEAEFGIPRPRKPLDRDLPEPEPG